MSDDQLHLRFMLDCREQGWDRLCYRWWYFKLCLLFHDGREPFKDEDNALYLTEFDTALMGEIGRCLQTLKIDYYLNCSTGEQWEINELLHNSFLRKEFCKVNRELLDLKKGELIVKDLSPPVPFDFT